MKYRKALLTFVSLLCLTLCMAGCAPEQDFTNLKDSLLNDWNSWMQSFSKHVLTRDSKLHGSKNEGCDAYTGSYTADYKNFSGEEFLFGGTALKRENGNELKATYTLKTSSGTASLYWLAGEEKQLLASDEASDSLTFTIGSGDNYIVLEGEDFCGSLNLTVE